MPIYWPSPNTSLIAHLSCWHTWILLRGLPQNTNVFRGSFMTRILIGDSHRVSKWTGQNPMQVFMLSALLGSSLAWNLGAGFVLWIMIHCSAHMLPPNPSSVAWQPLQKYIMKQLLKERRKHKPCRHHDCKCIFYLFCYVFLCGLCAWTLILTSKETQWASHKLESAMSRCKYTNQSFVVVVINALWEGLVDTWVIQIGQ